MSRAGYRSLIGGLCHNNLTPFLQDGLEPITFFYDVCWKIKQFDPIMER